MVEESAKKSKGQFEKRDKGKPLHAEQTFVCSHIVAHQRGMTSLSSDHSPIILPTVLVLSRPASLDPITQFMIVAFGKVNVISTGLNCSLFLFAFAAFRQCNIKGDGVPFGRQCQPFCRILLASGMQISRRGDPSVRGFSISLVGHGKIGVQLFKKNVRGSARAIMMLW